MFAKPESLGISVKYLNLSFLVRKPSGGARLVTSFGEVARHCKPQPSLMPSVENALRDIARWRFMIQTDLRQAFFQIPLAKSSMKYCGVTTPFKGVRVYTRSAMGMPGSETTLEELLNRVLGDLIQEGVVTKIADDLHVGGDSPSSLLFNWSRVLKALHDNSLGLNASKTIIAPETATVFGWIWSNGTIKASPHRIAALTRVSPPETVNGLRSFIGAFKVLSRVLKGYSDLLHPLDQAVAGKQSKDKVVWTEPLSDSFRAAQAALKDTKTIVVPRPEDQLWLSTDASPKRGGIGATLYALRGGSLRLAGFFNARLKNHQVKWLPCEVEALGIASALNHFAPYFIQSKHAPHVLTDSKPCVQAYQKLTRGEFSASSRVSTFLTSVSRYGAHISHVAGKANLPSDFASRNPVECPGGTCQVCKFTDDIQDSVVRSLSVKDILEGVTRMPFTNRVAWQATQMECPDLRRTHSHLKQGTRPSRKVTGRPEVKRYLREVDVASDGLLVVREVLPLQPTRERIVVPQSVLHGLLTALHIRCAHPSQYQLKQLFVRYFFALNTDAAVKSVSSSCHLCQSLASIPNHLMPQSTSAPPDRLGSTFSADVMRRYCQLVLVLREKVSSFTVTTFVDNEQRPTLRNAIIKLCATVVPPDSVLAIRVDPHPSLASLASDPFLQDHGIHLEVGCAKNSNKNPVAESTIRELGGECLTLQPEGGPISELTLAIATSNMNSRIRWCGLSAREIWTQRDQLTGEQLPIEDRQLIVQQHLRRSLSHGPNAASKATFKSPPPDQGISVGDLVYVKGDRDKTKAREKFLVCAIPDDGALLLRKFTLSQFRSKVYQVKREDCYLVSSDVKGQSPGPIRGLQDPTNPNPGDPGVVPRAPDTPLIAPHPTPHHPPSPAPPAPPRDTTVTVPRPPPELITPPPVDPDPPDHSADPNPLGDLNHTPLASTASEPPPNPQALSPPGERRSQRPRRPPDWQRRGEWDMS